MKDHLQQSKDFKVNLKNNQQQFPSELTSCMGGVILGKRKLEHFCGERGSDKNVIIVCDVQHEN